MHGDSESRLPRREEPDRWRLPSIDYLEVVRVRYARPRRHMVRGETVSLSEGVEILVHTDAPIPIRALSPALFIGDRQIAENETMGPNDYRFFVLDEKQLKPGAPILLGWVGTPPSSTTGDKPDDRTFRYERPTKTLSEISLNLKRGD